MKLELIDVMGSDQAIEEAARTSYGKGTRKTSETRGLIRYLMRHWHTTPFEMCEMKFLIECSMDTWRQVIRHRTANVNEYSTRYSVALDEKTVAGTDWRLQSTTNNQGSEDGYLVWPEEGYELEQALYDTPEEYLAEVEGTFHEVSDDVYQERLKFGVAREQARKDLPLSTYTRAFWKNDLHNILHFLRLRLDSHAQLEIREIAQEMAKHVKEHFPLTWEAFEDYRLNSINLSGPELLALREGDYSKLSKRELEELKEKKKFIYGDME